MAKETKVHVQYAALKSTVAPYFFFFFYKVRQLIPSADRESWGCAWIQALTVHQHGPAEHPFQDGEHMRRAFKHLPHWPWVCAVWNGCQSPHLLLQAHFTSQRQLFR